MTPPAAPRHRLLVFLPGTGQAPDGYETITHTGANAGFDALDLAWRNETTLNELCTSLTFKARNDCLTQTHGEISFGDRSGYDNTRRTNGHDDLVVPSADSIVGRLVTRIRALGWTDDYLSVDPAGTAGLYGGYLPRWSRIVIAGHSQGGGQSLFIATHRPALRVVTISGPDDQVNNQAPDWITADKTDNHTPLTEVWGLRADGEREYGDGELPNWTAYKFIDPNPSAPQSADAPAAPPYNGSHRLLTSLTPGTCSPLGCLPINRHGSTAFDDTLALDANGRPALTTAWQFEFTGGR